MRVYAIFLVLTVSMRLGEGDEPSIGGECKQAKRNFHEVRLTINRKLDESDGRYYRNFSAWNVDSDGVSTEITLDAKHTTLKCDGKTVGTHISAIVKELNIDQKSGYLCAANDRIVFHPKHGRNAKLLDSGRTVEKVDEEQRYNAIVFTNRPLKNNELFEVRLEKRTTKYNACLAIGVMSVTPKEVEIIGDMYQHKNITWMYHNRAIYHSKEVVVGNYGHDINTLQVRERLGVMRRDDGELHFFVNGIDQGPAGSNMPDALYGIFELRHDAVKGTIVY